MGLREHRQQLVRPARELVHVVFGDACFGGKCVERLAVLVTDLLVQFVDRELDRLKVFIARDPISTSR